MVAFNRIENIADDDYYKDGQSDLCVVKLNPDYDLSLDDVSFEYNPTPYKEVPVYLTMTNTGELAVDGFNVIITDVDGEENYNQIFDEIILPGESFDITALYTTGGNITPGDINVRVSALSVKESDTSNNELPLAVGLGDISIGDVEVEKSDNEYIISVNVRNSGYTDLSDVNISLSIEEYGDSIVSPQVFDTLPACKTSKATFKVDSSLLNNEEALSVLHIATSISSDDALYSNDSLGFILMQTDNLHIYGDANNDGNVTGSDAAYILQKVLDDSFELELEKLTTDYLKYTDVNADGILTSIDASMVLQKVLDNEYVFNCE
jgi:hypothetical protein